MDLSKITDVKELKSMVYDQLVAKETAEANINALQARLGQLNEQEPSHAEENVDTSDDR